jgi:hypothetical protein
VRRLVGEGQEGGPLVGEVQVERPDGDVRLARDVLRPRGVVALAANSFRAASEQPPRVSAFAPGSSIERVRNLNHVADYLSAMTNGQPVGVPVPQAGLEAASASPPAPAP